MRRRNSPWDIPFLSGNLEVLLLAPQALVSKEVFGRSTLILPLPSLTPIAECVC